MRKIKVHTCIKQEKVVYGLLEPGQANRCSCRQRVTLKKATKMVQDGEADWTVKSRTRGERLEICSLCDGTGDKSCAKCHGTHKTLEPYVEDIPADDIIMVSRAALADKKRSSAFKGKTPRVATIESEHIERAYVEGNRDAQLRIEEYGMLILDARTFVGPNRIPSIGVEPMNNIRTHEGRDYDYGRAV